MEGFDNPLVSIIMPVYGVELYIEKAILSVIEQSYKNWELLIINDGSIDGSREIAQKYSSLYSNIFLFDKENGGLSDARNYGLTYAKGKYVHFFDSDDWIEKDLYSIVIPFLERNNTDLLIFGYKVDTENLDGLLLKTQEKKSPKLDSFDEQFSSDLMKYDYLLNFAWNKIFLLKLLRENQLFFKKGLSVIEDIEFMSRVYPLVKRINFIPYMGYHYIYRETTSLSKGYRSDSINLSLQKIVYYKQMMRGFKISKIVLDDRINELAFGAISYMLNQLSLEPLSIFQKECRTILNNDYLILHVKKFKPLSLKDKILRLLFLSKSFLLVMLVYKLK